MMLKSICAASLLALTLYSCGSKQTAVNDNNPAYHNPTVQPFTDSILAFPENPNYYFLRAEALSSINNDSLALLDVIHAKSLDSNTQQYSYTIGYLQLQLGNFKEAIASLQENLKMSSGNVNTRILLAKAFLADNNIKDAQEQISHVLKAAPQHSGAMIMQANIDLNKKDTLAAISTLQQLLQTNPNDYQARFEMAGIYKAQNNEQAVAQYQQVFQLDTLDVTPLYNIGEFYESRKEMDKAKSFYTSCILKNRDFTDAYMALGKIFYQEKNTEKALRHFSLAVETYPNGAECYYWKGVCFEALHQKDSAIVNYNQALVFDNTLKEAIDGLRRMK